MFRVSYLKGKNGLPLSVRGLYLINHDSKTVQVSPAADIADPQHLQ